MLIFKGLRVSRRMAILFFLSLQNSVLNTEPQAVAGPSEYPGSGSPASPSSQSSGALSHFHKAVSRSGKGGVAKPLQICALPHLPPGLCLTL